ncbi:hypothetical protein [Novipirellula artificiosorum]|uniref:Uncharacterized protein n=1 Tax=Novipirellula artificiosorum TaxID=2528016 RepID=A0A5C6D1T4_9BACT|nr:hypothetical protein [Novipirellula artificiosorum]TWU31143.1 hypothetical protein Poly41_63340 [Novipirellula artificiosorum]
MLVAAANTVIYNGQFEFFNHTSADRFTCVRTIRPFAAFLAMTIVLGGFGSEASTQEIGELSIPTLVNEAAGTAEPEKELEEALRELDYQFDRCFAWWGEVYDPESGGFFYSISSKRNPHYGPFIEATAKAIHVLEWTGMMQQTSPKFRAGVIRYFQSRQNMETGFFRDPDYQNTIVLYNTANLLNIIQCNGETFNLELRIKIVQRSTEILSTMHAQNGGFVTQIGKASPSQNGIRLADDVLESNTNATGLAHKARNLLIQLATGKDESYLYRYSDDFLKALPK